jgi:hypothetical protein
MRINEHETQRADGATVYGQTDSISNEAWPRAGACKVRAPTRYSHMHTQIVC